MTKTKTNKPVKRPSFSKKAMPPMKTFNKKY